MAALISHERRRTEHWNVTRHPDATSAWPQIIAATAWGHQPRYLIRDRDARFGGAFNARLRRIGIRPIVARMIGTIRRDRLDHLLILHERHLRHALGEYVVHYIAVRPTKHSPASRPPDRAPSPRRAAC